tara:strand:+ start:1622 stop:1882 length:261 start_codon:yes stop_codon:yes gene_type:complete
MDFKQKQIIDDYANKISSKGFSTLAVFFLEMFKYLNFIFSQSMIFFGPIATVFFNSKKYYQISDIISNRSNVEYLICKIEDEVQAK